MHTNLVFPIHSRKSYNSDHLTYIKQIQDMYKKYHNSQLTYIEDEILFNQSCQFLKRQYQQYEFSNKIIMLSQYYQYHKQLPRIFQKEMNSIIQIYQEDIRNLEYQVVTKKMKQENNENDLLTQRQKKKPIDKIIKNIQLSYYNFEKKDIKKIKEQDKPKIMNICKNKKSMPTLPFYQNQNKNSQSIKNIHSKPSPAMIASLQPLKIKDINKISNKPKSKDNNIKKESLNSSFDSPKNLSRSKSKSNLVVLHGEHSKRNSVKPFQQITLQKKNQKTKSNPTSLQKTVSHKNFLKRQQPKKQIKGFEKLEQIKQNNGLKSMFKKVMQTKKVIKINR